MAPLAELDARPTRRCARIRRFIAELDRDLKHYVGRPSPIYHAERLSRHVGGAHILLKREDLNHTGAHKINNTIGQALVARRMGKPRIIAETGAGQHGVASATVAARLGLECVVYMGAVDIERQKINVYRMKLLGAEVVPVTSGSKTLKDALNEAMRDWVTNVADTFYIIGTVAGPHPYPQMVRDFNAIVGREARAQMLEQYGRLPDVAHRLRRWRLQRDRPVPCVPQRSRRAHRRRRGGRRGHRDRSPCRLAGAGRPGVLHGNRTYVLCDDNGQITETHSISAGLDYPGVGPEHAFLKDAGRAEYVGVTDDEALAAFHAGAHRRHPGRAGIQPRRGPGDEARARPAEGPPGAVQPVRSWRQGRAHDRRARRNPLVSAPGIGTGCDSNSGVEGNRIDRRFAELKAPVAPA